MPTDIKELLDKAYDCTLDGRLRSAIHHILEILLKLNEAIDSLNDKE